MSLTDVRSCTCHNNSRPDLPQYYRRHLVVPPALISYHPVHLIYFFDIFLMYSFTPTKKCVHINLPFHFLSYLSKTIHETSYYFSIYSSSSFLPTFLTLFPPYLYQPVCHTYNHMTLPMKLVICQLGERTFYTHYHILLSTITLNSYQHSHVSFYYLLFHLTFRKVIVISNFL